MNDLALFERDHIVGIFRGFSEGGLEFHADIVLPYKAEFQSIPMHGQFLLIQLATENEAVLGRITSMFSDGKLASGTGEDYGIRVVKDGREVPDDLRDQYLKYRVNVRVLGVVRNIAGKLEFAASHRRLPHVGSPVAFLSPSVLREIAGHNVVGADIGFFALGEFIYASGDKRLAIEPWMQPIAPSIIAKFDIAQLVSRRTFIFARAGFGKSNLTKLLFSSLYSGTPTVEKRGGRRVPVGTVIFDPDGEYFWPDDKNRPGLCDVPELRDKVVVFTRRGGPSAFYQSFVAGDIKLDIRRLKPSDVISIALSPEKQDQQNVRKLKSLNTGAWERLVNEIAQHGNQTDLQFMKDTLHLDTSGDAEAIAARSNMTAVVHMLHDRGSQMMDMLLTALRAGKLCVIDVSQLRGNPALVLSGLILQKIFDTNQEEFTKAEPNTIPTIAVVEEAQSVLGNTSGSSGEGPYVSWVKEGRKYDLGAVLITQQPGSISSEILSQGDNWFIFHLLSSGDLEAVKKANAHFSRDLLSGLLNEPIAGHGVFWSSSGGRPYPIPLRILSFEAKTALQDPTYCGTAVDTYASQLRAQYRNLLAAAAGDSQSAGAGPDKRERRSVNISQTLDGDGGDLFASADGDASGVGVLPGDELPAEESVDAMYAYRSQAIMLLRQDAALVAKLQSELGVPWMAVQKAIEVRLPTELADRSQAAFQLVPGALDALLGTGKWESVKRPKRDAPDRQVSWVRVRRDG